MTRTLDVKKLAAKNRKVDSKKLEEAIRMLRELRKNGVKYAEYELSPPFRRQMAVTNQEVEICTHEGFGGV